MRWWGGLVALGVGAGVGAALGAATGVDMEGNRNPKFGAAVGASAGLVLVGVASVGALFSPDTRAAGLTAAIPVGALVVAGALACGGCDKGALSS